MCYQCGRSGCYMARLYYTPAPRTAFVQSQPLTPTLASSAVFQDEVQLRFKPTPQTVIEKLLELFPADKGSTVYDLGCGDGRILVAYCKRYGTNGWGCDIDAKTVALAKDNIEQQGVSRSILIDERDATKVQLGDADVVYLFQHESLIEKLHPSLATVPLVISYQGRIPQLPTHKIEWDDNGTTQTLYVRDKLVDGGRTDWPATGAVAARRTTEAKAATIAAAPVSTPQGPYATYAEAERDGGLVYKVMERVCVNGKCSMVPRYYWRPL